MAPSGSRRSSRPPASPRAGRPRSSSPTGGSRSTARSRRIGAQVDGARAIIAVDGRVIGATTQKTYLLLHKPAGVTSTVRDRHAEQTVLDYLPTALVPGGCPALPGRTPGPRFGGPARPHQRRRVVRARPASALRRRARVRDRPAGPARQRAGGGPQGGHRGRGGPRDARRTAIDDRRPRSRSSPRSCGRRPSHSPGIGPRSPRAGSGSCAGCSGRSGRRSNASSASGSGPVRIDGLESGRVRPLKAPEVRGLGSGGGSSRSRPKPPPA